jgi:lon-related putative ATP-dependent protease
MIGELPHDKLRNFYDAELLPCKTTEGVKPLDDVIGQERALRALKFGLEIQEPGFNVYAAGRPGTGRTTTVKVFINTKSEKEDPPSDWCYVYNFRNPQEPNAIRLPKGRAEEFKKMMEEFHTNVRKVLPEAFQSEDYITRRESITRAAQAKRDALFNQINTIAQKKGFMLQSSESGLLVIPVVEGQPLSENDIKQLSEEDMKRINAARDELHADIRNAMRELRKIDVQTGADIEKLNHDTAHFAIDHFGDEVKDAYADVDEVSEYVDAVDEDITGNLPMFVQATSQEPQSREAMIARELFLKKYEINVLVDNSELDGAPVIEEINPTYLNLFGKIEKEARFGVLTTDLSMIRQGSLHKANGGYLIIPVEDLLRAPLSWDGLKRALKNQEIAIEDISQAAGVISARGLKPEPIPLNVKVVLIGTSQIYQLLFSQDPDFKELFKVKAHFDTTMKRNKKNITKYVQAMTSVCGKEGLLHLDAEAISKVIEYSSRLADDQDKLSTRFADVADIIREATFYAKKAKSPYVNKKHMLKAIDEKLYRANLVQEKIQEMIDRGSILIDTKGERVGQINGLTVMSYGDFQFGGPSRVTASIGVGRQGIVDVARESNLGGNIHTKGVLILSGYLSRMFAQDRPLSLNAQLVFEQSYSGVDGDSASSTELYAILSMLSGVPINQSFAVTGSVNQFGDIQPIGGVNEKIEGFFEVCKMRGLTGKQGVIIPASNVKNLMLKEEVVEAVKSSKFHIYSVKTIAEGIEILTGMKYGKRKKDGSFEEDTIAYLVDKRLQEMAETMKEYPAQN